MGVRTLAACHRGRQACRLHRSDDYLESAVRDEMTGCRRLLLVAALGFVLLERWQSVRELVMLHAWLDTWSGLGAVVVGMRRPTSRTSSNCIGDSTTSPCGCFTTHDVVSRTS